MATNQQKPKSSEDVRREIEAAEVTGAQSLKAIERLEAERHTALLAGKYSDVDKAEAALRRERLEVERQGEIAELLRSDLARAEKREAAEAVEREEAVARQVYEHCVKVVNEYPAIAVKLQRMLLVIDAGTAYLEGRAPALRLDPNEVRRTPVTRIPGTERREPVGASIITEGRYQNPQDAPVGTRLIKSPDQIVGGACPASLLDTVVLPGFKGEDPDFWSRYSARGGADYLDILVQEGLPVTAAQGVEASPAPVVDRGPGTATVSVAAPSSED